MFCPSAARLIQKEDPKRTQKRKQTEPQPPQRPILQLRICKRKIRGKRLESLSLPHLTYKKRRLCPHPHPMKRSMRNAAAAQQESSKQALGGPGGQRRATAPAYRPTHSPRGGLGSPFGVAMFLKRCDPSGLCSASNSIRAGGLDDGRYGSEELSPLRSPRQGRRRRGER